MKKIIFYLNDLGRGGAERVVSNLAAQFSKDQYEVIIAMSWKAENEYEVPKTVRKEYVSLDPKEEHGRFAILKSRIFGLRSLIKKENPDVIIAFGRSAIYRAVMADLFLKNPIIMTVRIDPRSEYTGIKNKICCYLVERKVKGCVFQTEEARSFFGKKLQRNSKIIMNPVNTSFLNLPENIVREKKIVSFGRLVKQKNHAMLIEAYAQLCNKTPNLREYILEIYGAGESDGTEELLSNLIKDNHLENQVFLMGTTDKVKDILLSSTLFVLSSNYEGMPNALLEAMVTGTPCISTDCPCGGPAMVVQDGINGLLVPFGDVQALEKAMDKVLTEEQFRNSIGEQAAKIVTQLDPDMVYNEWKNYSKYVSDRYMI